MKKYLFFVFTFYCIYENGSEFTLPQIKENSSNCKLKETIVKKLGDVLHANINLDEVSIEIRKFSLTQTELAIKDTSKCLSKSNKDDLKNILEDLKKLEYELDINTKSLKNKLSKLKKKFNIN